MKKLKIITLVFISIFIFSFCTKKNKAILAEVSQSNTNKTASIISAITNTFSTNTATISGPPSSYTNNPATQNSSLQVGGAGWSSLGCAQTSSMTLKGINGNIDVAVNFLFPPSTGTYAIGPLGPGACMLTVLNAPNQPANVTWHAQNGQVVVTTSASSITATFSGIVCKQQNFNFPFVTVSGYVNCL